MFCHHGAWWCPKHEVKLTHAHITYLYITHSLSCLPFYNMKQYYATWHLICLYFFENDTLVFQIFHFFFYRMSFVYSEENPEHQMTSLIPSTKYLQIFYLLSGCLMSTIHSPLHPQLQLNTNVQIIFDIFFLAPLSIFTVCTGFFSS